MPKVKTHRGAAKRFSLTKSGKIKMAHAFRTHKFTSKSSRQKRALRKTGYVGPEARNIKSLIPYK